MNIFKKIWMYLSFKKDKEAGSNINLKLMHGINRISLLMFLVALIILMKRCLT